MRVRTIVHVILSQAAWFAAVLGAANGMPWLGVVAIPVAFAVHLALSENRNAELLLALALRLLGSSRTRRSSQQVHSRHYRFSFLIPSVRSGW